MISSVMTSQSYLSSKAHVRFLPEKGGYGIFATGVISQDEIVCVWSGAVITIEELMALPPEQRKYAVQVEDDLYLATLGETEPADYVNHSCNPNIGFDGQIVLRALRDIAADEELCIDYAMCDGSPYDEFVCGCGTSTCRGQVRGTDWQLPELQERYAGHFIPYIQRKIADFVHT